MTDTWNGWTTSPTQSTRVIEPVPGVRLRVRNNKDVIEVFSYLVKQYHKRVDDLTKPHPADDWGFYYRANRNNPTKLSRHAFGLAIDLDATEHPNGVSIGKTFSAKQIAEIHKILAELDGIILWGGDFTHTVDGMHFEVNVSPAALKKRWAKIKSGVPGELPKNPTPRPAPTKKPQPRIVNEVLAGLWGTGVDRQKRLVKAGYNYDVIQTAVAKYLAIKKNVAVVAQEVVDGKWGNGSVRTARLKASGYDVAAVQTAVNKLLK